MIRRENVLHMGQRITKCMDDVLYTLGTVGREGKISRIMPGQKGCSAFLDLRIAVFRQYGFQCIKDHITDTQKDNIVLAFVLIDHIPIRVDMEFDKFHGVVVKAGPFTAQSSIALQGESITGSK